MGSGQPAQHLVRDILARCTNVTAWYRRSSRLDRHMAGPAASDLWAAPWLVRGRARWGWSGQSFTYGQNVPCDTLETRNRLTPWHYDGRTGFSAEAGHRAGRDRGVAQPIA